MVNQWNDLSTEEMGEAAMWYDDNPNHPNLYELSRRLDINSFSTLQRHCRNFLQYSRIFLGSREAMLPDGDIGPQPAEAPIITPKAMFNLPKPSDLQYPQKNTDQAQWLNWLYGRFESNPDLKVMHACDIHFPYQDDGAVQLFLELVRETQPDIIVVGSDAFDFKGLSAFMSDPDVREFDQDDDILAGVEFYWNRFIHDLKEAAPDAKLVFIWGNHERRLIRSVLTDAAQFRKRILGDFRKIIQCGGSVWWLGEVDYVRIGPLLVQHGNRHGIYAAKGHLSDLSFQLSTMQGHTHTPGVHEESGEEYDVASVMSGCLCQLTPHYLRARRGYRKWAHGTVIAMFSLHDRDVEFIRCKFRRDYTETEEQNWTYLGTERVRVTRPGAWLQSDTA